MSDEPEDIERVRCTFPKAPWVDADGREVQFQTFIQRAAEKSMSLYWFVDPDSRVPAKLQLVWLWVRRHVLRNLP